MSSTHLCSSSSSSSSRSSSRPMFTSETICSNIKGDASIPTSFVYTYCAFGDALYFSPKPRPFDSEHCEHVLPGIVVDYSLDEKVLGIEILGASSKLGCHFLDYVGEVAGKQPFQLSASFDATADMLTVRFTASAAEGKRIAAEDEDRLFFRVEDGRVLAVEIMNPSVNMA